MNEVAQYCEERNYHLIRKRGKGICLRLGVHKEELEQEFPEKNLCVETREYRISYIIRTLIESKEPYTAALFADELFVSKATIRTDIEKALATAVANVSGGASIDSELKTAQDTVEFNMNQQ